MNEGPLRLLDIFNFKMGVCTILMKRVWGHSREGSEGGGLLLTGFRDSALQDEKDSRVWPYNNINIFNTTELNT